MQDFVFRVANRHFEIERAADPRRGSGSKAEATHPAGDKEYAEPAHIRGVSASAKEKGLSPKEQSS